MSTSHSRTRSSISYSNFNAVLKEVATGIWKAVKEARGNCVSFTPKKVLEYAGVNEDVKPIMLTLVRYILDELVKKNLLQKDEKRYRVCRYNICEDGSMTENQLWTLCKSSDTPDSVIKLIRSIVE